MRTTVAVERLNTTDKTFNSNSNECSRSSKSREKRILTLLTRNLLPPRLIPSKKVDTIKQQLDKTEIKFGVALFLLLEALSQHCTVWYCSVLKWSIQLSWQKPNKYREAFFSKNKKVWKIEDQLISGCSRLKKNIIFKTKKQIA